MLSVSFTWIWLVITEPQETPFLLLELQSFTRKMTSEDLNLTYSERMASNSPSQEQFQEPATEDTDQSSRPQNQELLNNDLYNLFKIIL